MIRRILDGLGYLFLTPPPIERERPRVVQAHPEPRPRSAAASDRLDPELVRQMADRGYRLVDPGPFAAAFVRETPPAVHYHPEDPGLACTCTRDTPDGQL